VRKAIHGLSNVTRPIVILAPLLVLSVVSLDGVQAEYADIIMNRYADREDVRPVIFQHWFHRIRYQCRVCHTELGFEMRAGSNDITMDKITAGEYCGACHNGEIAWSPDNCDLCHAAVPGTPPGVQRGHQTVGPGSL